MFIDYLYVLLGYRSLCYIITISICFQLLKVRFTMEGLTKEILEARIKPRITQQRNLPVKRVISASAVSSQPKPALQYGCGG